MHKIAFMLYLVFILEDIVAFPRCETSSLVSHYVWGSNVQKFVGYLFCYFSNSTVHKQWDHHYTHFFRNLIVFSTTYTFFSGVKLGTELHHVSIYTELIRQGINSAADKSNPGSTRA